MKTDSEIQRDVLDELRRDTRVRETDVGVEVHQGVVTLTGVVRRPAERLAAQEAAHRAPDVLDVANDIDVKQIDPSDPTDTDIALAVGTALEWNAVVPREQIHTTVTAGIVTLEGNVGNPSQSEEAARAVRHVRGVLEVVNRIAVLPDRVAFPAR
ncbi:BON domain-containing protein [Pendulispora brunnea]|uniref:BON domain-containing protein n=1 Tax=Pendulispora brunnea TaxID=2905690 RepID=A0ABZ2JYX2_9BACT